MDRAITEEYIEQRDGYFVKGTRVSLDSVVYAFLKGESPEGIVQSFPALEIEQILGALEFYSADRYIVDSYLAEGRREFEILRREARLKDPELYSKLDGARQRVRILSE